MINEVLTKSTPAGEWIKDFVDSDNPKFAGKSAAKRKQMALAAYYAKKNESVEEAAAVSQNSTAMQDMNEDHLVHVNDGSKYDEQPHEKDVEHVMAGVKQHGGEHAGASDKGVFFKFKSPEHASSFISHVNKCPHRSCDAHMSESVEYKGIGTDVVDKKKKLNPQPNFTMTKKTVKDFKEAKELDKACWKGYKAIGLKNKNGRQVPNCVPEEKELEEAKVYDPFTKKMVPTKPIKVQAGGGATRNGVPVEGGPSKYKTLGDAYRAATAGQTVTPKQKLKNEEAEPIDELSKGLVARYANKAAKTTQANYDKSKDKFQFSSGRQDGMKNAVKRLTKEEVELIDELSKDTLASYAKKASHDARIKQHVAADFKSKQAHARNPRKKESWGSIAKKYQSKAWKREDGHDKAVDKLAKEEVQIDESSLHRQHFQMVADLIRGHESAEKRKELAHHHAELFKKANPRFDHAKFMKAAGVNEEVELIAKHEVKADAPHKTSGHVILTKSSDKWHVLHNKKSSPDAKDLHRSKLLHSYDNEKEARAKFKELHEEQIDEAKSITFHEPAKFHDAVDKELDHNKSNFNVKVMSRDLNHIKNNIDKSGKFHGHADHVEQAQKFAKRHKLAHTIGESVKIDEISKSTLARYIPSAARDVGSHTYAGKEAGEWASHYTRAGDWSAAEKHSKKSYADFKKANKRIAGIDRATKKLATQKEEVQVDEGNGLPHALVQAGKSKWHIYDTKTREVHSTYNNKNVAMKKYDELNDKHAGYDSPGGLVRSKYGVRQEPMRKEEVELDEAIAKKLPVQHAVDAVHKTLGPKSATRFLSHLSPGSDKHTTWDKVNDALVKQGVQTHHIASIAQKTSHMNEEVVDESRGHKVLATFFKNREVAQRAYHGNPARDSEVAAGGGSPAEQGIAAAKADYKKMNKIKEDQYTSEYKIKQFVDPITGENKTRKIRPHRVNFKSSKMNAAPAQDTDQVKVNEGHDDYSSIAKELVKKHGKNVTAQHVKDFAGQRDTHRGLDHAEVMHHVKKLSEDDKVYDEKWKKFTKGAK